MSEFKTETFEIEIKRVRKKVVRFSGGFATSSTYYIVEGKKTRRPSSYEYQKIYRKLKEERVQ